MPQTDGKEYFITNTNVEMPVSDKFFCWTHALGGMVQILAPTDVVKKMKKTVKKVQAVHKMELPYDI